MLEYADIAFMVKFCFYGVYYMNRFWKLKVSFLSFTRNSWSFTRNYFFLKLSFHCSTCNLLIFIAWKPSLHRSLRILHFLLMTFSAIHVWIHQCSRVTLSSSDYETWNAVYLSGINVLFLQKTMRELHFLFIVVF